MDVDDAESGAEEERALQDVDVRLMRGIVEKGGLYMFVRGEGEAVEVVL